MNEKMRNKGAIEYFHNRIEEFDDIYKENKSAVISFLNRTIRASVKARFQLAFEILGDLSGKSVLDIGCGSGRYMFKAAEKNASRIVGIDAAAGALEQAGKIANELGLKERMKFVESDFIDFSTDGKFDVILAVGYFDYIFNPDDHLKKIIEISDGIIYASFPKVWSLFTITRKIRLMLNRCPVRFYTKSGIKKLLQKMNVDNYELKTVYRDYILIIRK